LTLLPILGLLSSVIFLATGCAKLTYLPTEERIHYAPSNDIAVFWEEPKRPYKIIGRISVYSHSLSEEGLFRKLKQRAAEEGAHAIILGGSTQTSSIRGTPAAHGGTVITPVISQRLEALVIRWTDIDALVEVPGLADQSARASLPPPANLHALRPLLRP